MKLVRLWTRDELILAINLYSKIELGKRHDRNPKILELSKLNNRTPASVACKDVSFVSFDEFLVFKEARE